MPGAGGRVDPPAGDEAVLERLEEHRLPGAPARPRPPASARATRRRTARAISGAVEVALGALGVLLAQHVEADLLPGRDRRRRRGRGTLSGLFMGGIFRRVGIQYLAMPLHLLKLCVGCDASRTWSTGRPSGSPRRRAAGTPPSPFHVTRMWPRREAELARRRLALLGDPRPGARAPAHPRARAARRRRRHRRAARSGSTRGWCARCRSRAAPSRAGATCGRRTRRADLPPPPAPPTCRRRLALGLAEIGVL